MSDNNIDKAMLPDLSGSWPALRRAAQRARVAAQTGTELIISRNGVIERIQPPVKNAVVQESCPPYGDKL